MKTSCLLIDVLKNPEVVKQFGVKEWELTIRQARASLLLSRLGYILELNELESFIPEHAKRHIESANTISRKQLNSVHWELECLKKELSKYPGDVVLLKGAAYVARGLPSSHGRIFSDVDILVAESDIKEVEKQLILNGWLRKPIDQYDRNYYEKWMHEIPPMISRKRSTVLDMHHNILPKTTKIKLDANKLLESAISFSDKTPHKTFCPEDMVIHSAVHLFYDGEFERGLRDLVDLKAMIEHFVQEDANFLNRVVNRSVALGVSLPVFYAFRYLQKILELPIGTEINKELDKYGPQFLSMMDAIFIRALMPAHSSCDDKFTAIARWLLYVRSHYLRMPLYLLIPHLVRKAYKKRFDDTAKSDAN